MTMTNIAENLQRVRDRIAHAALRVGRDPTDILLIGAAKTRSAAEVQAAVDAGLRDIGENYVQEAQAKFQVVGRAARWHFIGHLQRNKAKDAVELFDWIHSVDSLRLAQALSQRAQQRGQVVSVLLEIQVGDEPTKFGLRPEEALAQVESIAALPGLRIEGLMTMPPFREDPDQVRPFFRQVRRLAEQIEAFKLKNVAMQYLSMGMSHDFEVAIEEGANMVRVGTALFGPRGG